MSDSSKLEVDPRVAGFGRRAGARAIDTVFGFVVGIVAINVAVIALAVRGTPGTPEEWLQSISSYSWTSVSFSMMGGLAYFTLSEWIGAATVGKLVCGLRVASEDFGHLAFTGAAIRSAAFFIDALVFGLPGYIAMDGSPLRQRLGDRWGGTVVVRRREVPEAGRGAFLVGVGCLAGTAAWAGIYAYALVQQVSRAG